MKRALLALTFIATLGGCTTVSNWFADEDEIKIRELKPINAVFQPNVVWQHEVGDGVDDFFSRLEPAIGYDKIFAADRHGLVRAFELQSGKPLWKTNLSEFKDDGMLSGITNMWKEGESARISGGLVVAYDKLYFGTENGTVFALDQQTGETKWKVHVHGEVIAPPAVDEGIVAVNTSSGVMFALDAENGEEKWRYESEVPALSLRGVSTPTLAGGGVLVGTAMGKLAVVLSENGQVAWEQAVASPTGFTELDRLADIDVEPLVMGGIAYIVSYDGTLAAVELRSGRVIWKREYKSYRNLSIEGNNLFVTDNDSVIYALDRRSGVERWSNSALRSRLVTGAAPVGSYVVVGDKFGFLHWMNQSDGEIIARANIGGDDEDEGIYTTPIVEGRTVYTQTRSGELFAVETP
ncbi:outer membrane protein assembly factor BamB [Neptunicella marina]|uniref:Outer membrane protein assembly factor BamB n=1 Tax=Neptunicella marina TaxID=2125989 RepID=A0A8J6IUS8_9ALTE|nr:outer membrane protein assembly factor BamB [Neptunicella marina]